MAPRRVLLVVSGGIAAYKIPELVRHLTGEGHEVRCVLTREAVHFVSPLVLQTLSHHPVRDALFDAAEEGEIDHIALARWPDLVVVAPATAHLLARMSLGLADDLASTLLLATRAPVLVAPAMNVQMWEHPATREHAERLRERGVHFVGPEPGPLACGEEGPGRMAEPERIAAEAALLLGPARLRGRTVVVSAGGTQEPVDPVRVLSNRSSGKMGYAVAAEAARRGARVVLVSAPTALATPPGVARRDVRTALEMRDALREAVAGADVLVMAAAVSDFRPARPRETKWKKDELGDRQRIVLELERNPDILAELAADGRERVVVGFAAETGDPVPAARRKLEAKGCDLVVANDVSREGAGFEVDTNSVYFVWPGGEVEELPQLSKREVARRLLDRIEKLLERRG